MSFAVRYTKPDSESARVWLPLHDEVPPQDVCRVRVVIIDKAGAVGPSLTLSLPQTAASLDRVAHFVTDIKIINWGVGSTFHESITDLGDVIRVCPKVCLHRFRCVGGIADLSSATGDLHIDSAPDIQELWVNRANTGSITVIGCPNLTSIRAPSGGTLHITSLDMSACAWQLAEAARGLTHLKSLWIRSMAMHGQMCQPAWLPLSLESLTLYQLERDAEDAHANGPNSVVLADLPELRDFVAVKCEHVASIIFAENLPVLSTITVSQLTALHTLSSPSGTLSGLPRLAELECDKCTNLTSLTVEMLPLLRMMTVVDCPNVTSLTVSGSTLPRLRNLALLHNKLGDGGCRFEGRFDNLSVLMAVNEDLTKVPIHTRRLTSLAMLDLSMNRCWRPVDLSFSPQLAEVRFAGNTPEPVDMFGRQNQLRVIVRPTALGLLPVFVPGPESVMVLCDTR